jgi:hypothetical protein
MCDEGEKKNQQKELGQGLNRGCMMKEEKEQKIWFVV